MLDCGKDWLGRVGRLRPDAIVLTHAHLDHAGGLRRGSAGPVFATEETVGALADYPLMATGILKPKTPRVISNMTFEPYPLEHSVLAPAVGYRMTAGRARVFYAPDVAAIRDPQHALAGVQVYIGDGATQTRPLLRRRGRELIGHASIRTQLEWCRRAGIGQAVFTHCGTAIVAGDEGAACRAVEAMGREFGVRARVAYDGMPIRLR